MEPDSPFQNFTCYESLMESVNWLNNILFWMNGVGTIGIASFGIVGNLMALQVLRKMGSKNFYRLLMVLGNVSLLQF